MRLRPLVFVIFFFIVAGFTLPAAFAAPIVYAVTVDTNSQRTNDGYIDILFNPSSSPTQPATAMVVNFLSDGVLNPLDSNNGSSPGVTGTLPGPLTYTNTNTTNEYTERMTFGTTITFDLVLDGPAVESPDPTNFPGGSVFQLDFINSAFTDYLFVNDPDNTGGNDPTGFVAGWVNLNPDGSTDTMTNPSPGNGPPVVTFTELPTLPTPEPASWLLLAAGLGAIGVLARKRLAA